MVERSVVAHRFVGLASAAGIAAALSLADEAQCGRAGRVAIQAPSGPPGVHAWYGTRGSRPAARMSAAAAAGSTGAFGAHHRHGPALRRGFRHRPVRIGRPFRGSRRRLIAKLTKLSAQDGYGTPASTVRLRPPVEGPPMPPAPEPSTLLTTYPISGAVPGNPPRHHAAGTPLPARLAGHRTEEGHGQVSRLRCGSDRRHRQRHLAGGGRIRGVTEIRAKGAMR